MESATLTRDFMVKLVWRSFGALMEKTWLIKLPENLHINFTIKTL